MLTAAFDCGGDGKTACLTVAGFVSGTKDWDEFSLRWKERLSRDGIEYFHAVEAAHFSKQFRRWREDLSRNKLREALFADLMDILLRNVYRKFGCTIVNKDFALLSEENKQYYKLRAYTFAARNCIKHVRDWAREEHITTPIEYVFEAGDLGEGDLRNRLRIDTGREPTFKPKKDTQLGDGTFEYGFVPLQSADWLAYEYNLANDRIENNSLKSLRWPFQQFDSKLGELSTYTEDDMREQDRLFSLNREINKWTKELKRIS